MTTRHDPAAPLEPLTPEERDWAARLALIGPHDGPPSALDTKILAAAYAAVAQHPHRRSQRRRWPTLVGATASLVIVIGFAWQLQPLLRSRPSLIEGPVASAPMAASEGSLSEDVLAAADPVAQTAVESPRPAPAPATQVSSQRPHQDIAKARRNPSRASPAPSREFGDDAIPPYTDYAGVAAARRAASESAENHATARASTDERRARGAAASPQAFPTTRTDDAADAMAMPAPPPPAASASAGGAYAPASDASARKATTAPPPAAQAEQDNTPLDRVQVTGSRIEKAYPPVREDARLEPVAWLQRIRDRRDVHDLEGARESLALFRQSYPRTRLPADLAQLGR